MATWQRWHHRHHGTCGAGSCSQTWNVEDAAGNLSVTGGISGTGNLTLVIGAGHRHRRSAANYLRVTP